jgi:hypothetical protein
MDDGAPAPVGRPPAGRWEGTLDDFESMLEGYIVLSVAAHDAPGETVPPLPSFTPPDNLGPLPEHLRLRATELSSRARLIETELGRVRDETATQLAALNRPRAVYDHDRPTSTFHGVG